MVQKDSATLDWVAIWNAAEDARLVRGWTKRDLHQRADISHTAYRDMQLGKPLRRIDKIHSFIAALGWTMGDLEEVGVGGESPEIMLPEESAELEDLRQQVAALQDLLLTLHRAVRENTQTIRLLRRSSPLELDEVPEPGTPDC